MAGNRREEQSARPCAGRPSASRPGCARVDNSPRIRCPAHAALLRRLQWLSESDLERLQLHSALRTPELILFAKMVTTDNINDVDIMDMEIGQLIEVDEDSVLLSAGDAGGAATANAGSPQVQLLEAAKYTTEDQLRLFREFVTLSFPALYMSRHVFTQLMLEVGWQAATCPDLFRQAGSRLNV
ncbi:unnamed protein product, partial [Iphiclides podalirius]